MEENRRPYWYILLRHFENKGYIHNGLTIPFIIGARERLEPKEKLFTIEELMMSINEIGGTILECSNIGEFVIGTVDFETLKFKHLYPNIIDNIIVTDNSLSMVKNLEELIAHFKNCYQNHIESAEYSKNHGTWGYFTEEDLKKLDEIK